MIQKAILQIDCSKGTKKNGSANKGLQTAGNVASDAAQRLKQTPSDSKQGNKPQSDIAQDSMSQSAIITVQYNPASIKYHAAGSTQQNVQTHDVGENTETVKTITRNSSLDMSFELVFHKTDDDESVREQMELVMEMINKSPTKNVKFAWGKLEVDGKLTSFSGEYDMFDKSGNPISGHMNMTIRTAMSAKHEERTLDKIDKERKNTQNGDLHIGEKL